MGGTSITNEASSIGAIVRARGEDGREFGAIFRARTKIDIAFVIPTPVATYTEETMRASPSLAFRQRGSAFEWVAVLVREQRNELLRVARREGVAVDDAIDCVQDAIGTFLRRAECAALAAAPDEAMRFLCAIVRNEARNARRRTRTAATRDGGNGSLDSIAVEADSPDARIEREEARDALRRCLFELDDLPRSVVSMRMLDEWPAAEVAESLGLTTAHVAVLLHRAKARLRGCMNAAGHCADSCLDDD